MKGARILIVLIIIGSLISAGAAFYKFYIARDYLVFANVPCDPAQHSCFVGNGEDTPQYYATVSKVANTIPRCNGWADQCAELSCADNELSCTVQYCEPGGEETCYSAVPTGQ